MSYKLIGKNFTPPDVMAKVTGKAKYSEDFRADGMLFCKLLLSPMPHGRVLNIDTSEALKMPGVAGILTADDVPPIPKPATPILTNEPLYVGDPILALAAESEELAAEAIEKIKIDLEPLPFTVDPLESLYPDGPNARSDGNSAGGYGKSGFIDTVKWTARDFAAVKEGELPMGQHKYEWSYGDIETGFNKAKLTLDESFITASTAHHCLESRSAMAYWQNGKCFLHGSVQSQSFAVPYVARYIGIKPEDLVFIAEYCGGGFGSKGVAYPIMAIPAYMSKKTSRPVMIRITRSEEYFLGTARPGFQGRLKIGFSDDGRVTAVDLYIVQENGPYSGGSDYLSAADAISLVYTPENMRFRGIPVQTNTPPRGAQRGPGQNQIACIIEPILDKAAKELGIDRMTIRKINAPDNHTKYGQKQGPVTSAYLTDAIERGAEEFNWQEKKLLSGKRNGSKVIGIGIGQAYHSAGASGYDGLVRITPDGKLHIHTGVGNLGTYSYSATSRVAAEILNYDWENCVIERGDSRKHLPWNFGQFGSNTTFTMSRTNYVAAMDARNKLLEIAAMDLGGTIDEYELKDEKVIHKSDSTRQLSYAAIAQRAIELGNKFDGHEAPEDINDMTKRSVAGLAGTGLIGVAKDNLEKNGTPPALVVGFMQIELDLETGKHEILDYVAVADCGTVVHPMGLSQQIKGGAVMGIGMAALERHVYDPQNGLPANVGLLDSKLPTFLDVPAHMSAFAVDKPDPQNPVGARGIGEPVQGAAAAALLGAISDALGGHYFNRTPVVADMVINAASGRPQSHKPLQVNTF
ncbi:MAG: xanthine dehydrogenase family protein molybdopterin-binding subunit [Gammaproteobacteria bacterium]|nr:xanthine dehydrogenase family protein molybdopterin-binding subunit [Gammaproteobacteria bacterium]